MKRATPARSRTRRPYTGGLLATLASALALAIPVSASGSEIVFSDSELARVDWTTLQHGGSGFVSTVSTGGNPGSFAELSWNSGSVVEMRNDALVHPALVGAITSIGYQEDLLCPCAGLGQAFGPALLQDGVIFVVDPARGFTSGFHSSWWALPPLFIGIDTTALIEADFVALTTSPENTVIPGLHPDFSTNGSVLQLGYYRGAHVSFGTLTGGIDNWHVTVRTSDPGVPSIGMYGLALLAFGLALTGSRRLA